MKKLALITASLALLATPVLAQSTVTTGAAPAEAKFSTVSKEEMFSSKLKGLNITNQKDETIGEISEISNTIASAVEEQGATTKEIARSVQQAATGNQQVSGLMNDIQNDTSETLSATGELTGAASGLGAQSEALRDAVDGFLRDVRAA